MTTSPAVPAAIRRELAVRAAGLARVVDRAAERILDDDPVVAARAAHELVAALWPAGGPPPSWWSESALGRACATALAGLDRTPISRGEAAQILGRCRTICAPLVARGQLERAGRGGRDVLRGEILTRLVRLSQAA